MASDAPTVGGRVRDTTPMSDIARHLEERILSRDAVVGVIGLGYVGLPLALAFAEGGFRVLGFDVDPDKPRAIENGRCYIRHLDADRLRRVVAPGGNDSGGRLEATTDFDRLGEPDALLICVPTPLTPHREPDLSYVEDTMRAVRRRLRPGQLIVLESTTYPGTTDELVRTILEGSAGDAGRAQAGGPADPGFRCGDNLFIAFSPEREDPGNPLFGTTDIPKVVGGVESVSGDLAATLYGRVIDRIVRVGSARAAEASKLTENIFRAVNIALVNELKIIYDRMGIDVWEVLDAAETKPFGFMRFNPGPGWGGHCIPLDPFYLSWKAREVGVMTRFIELAGEVNVGMPGFVIGKLQDALNRQGKPLKGARILILGLAYKRDIDDPRESPAFEIIARLLGSGAEVEYHDPHIPTAPAMRTWPDLPPLRSVPLDEHHLGRSDAVVVVTDHTAVDYDLVLRHAPLVVDTRGVYRGSDPKVVRA